MRRLAIPLILLVIAVLACEMGGCSHTPKPVSPPTSTVESSGGYGLELRLWPVNDSAGSIARIFSPFDQAESPIDKRTLTRLSNSGLRALVVPTDSLDLLASQLHFDGKIEKQAARERTDWSVFVAGKAWNGFVTLRSADGNMELRAGQLRLIGRGWIAPGRIENSTIPAVLRVEIAGRHVEQASGYSQFEEMLKPQSQRSKETDGLPLDALKLSIELKADQSLVLLSEDPDLDWADAARLSNYIEKEPEANEETDAAKSQKVGPAVPKTSTLGHALLTDALFQFEPRHRAILVIVPRVPAEFRLQR